MSTATEIARILALPVQGAPDDAWTEQASRQLCSAEAWTMPGFRGLFPEQAFGLSTYAQTGTLVGIIGAGGGKTVLAYGCANIGWQNFGRRKILILTTNSVYEQFVRQGREEARKILGVSLPMVDLYGVFGARHSKAKRLSMVRQHSEGGVFTMPYSFLSQRWSEELLMEIQPDLVIADEAHKLRNIETAAGPPRLFRAMQAYQDRTKDRAHFLPMSGTLTERGLFDCWRLFAMAMGDHSPLPIQKAAADEVGELVDASPDEVVQITQVGGSLLSWAEKSVPPAEDKPYTRDQVGVRRSMQARIVNTPGVVRSKGALAPSELIVKIHDGQFRPDAVTDSHMESIDVGIAPNGDEIDFALHSYKWRVEVTSGFYNDLYWDEEKWEPSALERAKEHHELRQEYYKLQRGWLQYNRRPGMDSPWLLQGHFTRFKSGEEKLQCDLEVYQAWNDMKNAEFEGMPERSKRPVWFSDHRLLNVTAMAMESIQRSQSVLLWCKHNSFRERLVEFLSHNGLPVVDCPSGSAHLLPKFPDTPKKPTVYVLMQRGYAEGLNLQHGWIQGFAEWARGASLAEQCIARQHRNKQPSDVCEVHTFHESEFDRQLMAATITNSAYAVQTFGTRQRLMVASYEPPPKMYPRAFLAERIPDVENLSPEAERDLLRKFAS